MSKFTVLNEVLYDYLWASIDREPELLRRLREETATQSFSGMQIAPDQGQFMGLLVKLMGARRTLEIGTYTGYSACHAGRLLDSVLRRLQGVDRHRPALLD